MSSHRRFQPKAYEDGLLRRFHQGNLAGCTSQQNANNASTYIALER